MIKVIFDKSTLVNGVKYYFKGPKAVDLPDGLAPEVRKLLAANRCHLAPGQAYPIDNRPLPVPRKTTEPSGTKK